MRVLFCFRRVVAIFMLWEGQVNILWFLWFYSQDQYVCFVEIVVEFYLRICLVFVKVTFFSKYKKLLQRKFVVILGVLNRKFILVLIIRQRLKDYFFIIEYSDGGVLGRVGIVYLEDFIFGLFVGVRFLGEVVVFFLERCDYLVAILISL